jgi:hypothetical protein
MNSLGVQIACASQAKFLWKSQIAAEPGNLATKTKGRQAQRYTNRKSVCPNCVKSVYHDTLVFENLSTIEPGNRFKETWLTPAQCIHNIGNHWFVQFIYVRGNKINTEVKLKKRSCCLLFNVQDKVTKLWGKN